MTFDVCREAAPAEFARGPKKGRFVVCAPKWHRGYCWRVCFSSMKTGLMPPEQGQSICRARWRLSRAICFSFHDALRPTSSTCFEGHESSGRGPRSTEDVARRLALLRRDELGGDVVRRVARGARRLRRLEPRPRAAPPRAKVRPRRAVEAELGARLVARRDLAPEEAAHGARERQQRARLEARGALLLLLHGPPRRHLFRSLCALRPHTHRTDTHTPPRKNALRRQHRRCVMKS